MYRTDADDHENNLFQDGGPGKKATVVDSAWGNDKQEELCLLVEAMGITLEKGNWTQLQDALKILLRDYPEIYTTAGSGGAYTITTTPAITSYSNGMKFYLHMHLGTLGTDTITLNVDTVGAKPFRAPGGRAFITNELMVNQIVVAVYITSVDQIWAISISNEELFDARGAKATLPDRLAESIKPDGKILNTGFNGLCQCWARQVIGGTNQLWRISSISALAGLGNYRLDFSDPPSSDWTSTDKILALIHVDSLTNAHLWSCEITGRYTGYVTVRWKNNGTQQDLPSGASASYCFFGEVF